MASVSRAHRMLTNPAIQNTTIPASAEVIATKTFEQILRNLKKHDFSTSRLRLLGFQWLFPKSEVTQQQLSIFLALRSGFWNSRAFCPRHVVFINLWPWLWHSSTTLGDAIRFVQQHLSILRPLVVATFSQSTTSIVRANFESKVVTPELSSIVGEITIQYHGPEGDEDGAFLAIPHIDPDFTKYVDFNLNQVVH